MIKSRNVIEITESKFRAKYQGGEKYMYKRKSVENQKKKIGPRPIPAQMLLIL